jgi:hypothetical protein
MTREDLRMVFRELGDWFRDDPYERDAHEMLIYVRAQLAQYLGEPLPFNATWKGLDQQRALYEGWGIFGDHGASRVEIRHVEDPRDGPRIFGSDDEAVVHVRRRAAESSWLHVKALLLHKGDEGNAGSRRSSNRLLGQAVNS